MRSALRGQRSRMWAACAWPAPQVHADSGASHAAERRETSGQYVGQILPACRRLPVFAELTVRLLQAHDVATSRRPAEIDSEIGKPRLLHWLRQHVAQREFEIGTVIFPALMGEHRQD